MAQYHHKRTKLYILAMDRIVSTATDDVVDNRFAAAAAATVTAVAVFEFRSLFILFVVVVVVESIKIN